MSTCRRIELDATACAKLKLQCKDRVSDPWDRRQAVAGSLGAVREGRPPLGFGESEGLLTGMGAKESRMTQFGAEGLCPIVLEGAYPQKSTGDNTQEVGFGAFD